MRLADLTLAALSATLPAARGTGHVNAHDFRPQRDRLLQDFKPHRDRLLPLDGIRAYAVLMVFLVHYVGNLSGYIGKPIGQANVLSIFLTWLYGSNYGVHMFFVLSGFLIGRMFVLQPGLSYWVFLKRRFLRIYPAFLISLLIAGPIAIFVTHFVTLTPRLIIENLLFLNGWFAYGEVISYNYVTWSLFFEFVFYLTLPLAFVLLRRPVETPARLLLGFMVIALTAVILRLGSTYMFFFAGFALANMHDNRLHAIAEKIPESWLVVAYAITTALYSFGGFGTDMFVIMYAAVASAAVIKTAYGNGVLNRLSMHPGLQQLGRISYSFYLLHACIVMLYFNVAPQWFGPGQWLVAVLSLPITFGATWLGATGLYRLAEQPYFQSHGAKLPPPTSVPEPVEAPEILRTGT